MKAETPLHRSCLVGAFVLASCQAQPPNSVSSTEPVAFEAAPPRLEAEDAIRIELRFPKPHRRQFEVTASYPVTSTTAVFAMPVWIPGSYLLREFSKNVVDLSAFGYSESEDQGRPIAIKPLSKNRFSVNARNLTRIAVRYTLLAHELSVRTNFVEPEFAVINPAASFYQPLGMAGTTLAGADQVPAVPIQVRLLLPEGWFSASSLQKLDGAYLAATFDDLVDAPFLLGEGRIDVFEVDDRPFRLVSVGDLRGLPSERATLDLADMVTTMHRFWGVVPYPNYAFLQVLDDTRGGLEHKNSTLLMARHGQFSGQDGYRQWLSLACHELFHAWNGKRLRPKNLGPFNLEREQYTEALWWIEGLTTYYADLLLRRANIHTDETYLEHLSEQIQRLQETGSQPHQSLAEASFQTWIEFYRPDEASNNSAVNYYLKGALAGFVLDAKIRASSGNRKSLDDVLRYAYRTYPDGYEDNDLFGAIREVAGSEVARSARALIRDREELTFDQALKTFGLHIQTHSMDDPEPFLGANFSAHNRVSSVLEGSPAAEAGLLPGDEVVFIGLDRVSEEGPKALLERYVPDDEIEFTVARRGRLRRTTAKLSKKPQKTELAINPEAPRKARRIRYTWLNRR